MDSFISLTIRTTSCAIVVDSPSLNPSGPSMTYQRKTVTGFINVIRPIQRFSTRMPTFRRPQLHCHGLAVVKLRGLRVAVDGYDLGPHEMGTQVALLSAVDALARNPKVRELLVMMAGPVPPYAKAVLEHPKIQTAVAPPGRFSEFERCDIVIRMGNPNPGFQARLWRQLADRVIVSVLDLIVHRIGIYHENEVRWLEIAKVSVTACPRLTLSPYL